MVLIPCYYSDDQNAEGFGSFLDDFAVNVFLPQIEEKVMQLINQATAGKYDLLVRHIHQSNILSKSYVSGTDAFQDDRNYRNYSKYPITKVTHTCME